SAFLKVKTGGYDVVWTDLKKRLRDKSLMCHWSTPIHQDGYVYGCSGRHTEQPELRCVELKTGKVMWSQPSMTRTSLLMIDNDFVCLGEDGVLYLLKVNPTKYEEVSQIEFKMPGQNRLLFEYPCWAAPILAHGLLYVRGNDRLVCFELILQKK